MNKVMRDSQTTKIKHLRNVLLIFLFISISLAGYNVFFIYPSMTEMVIENTKNDALRVAKYLADTFMRSNKRTLDSHFNGTEKNIINRVIETFELEELKIFSRSGRIVFSSRKKDIGRLNKEPYFKEFVAKGNIYASLVKKNTLSGEGRKLSASVVEIYVPQMKDGQFLGAFEIYYNITRQQEKFDRLVSFSSNGLVGMSIVLMAAVFLVWLKEKKSERIRRRVESALEKSEKKLAGILNSFADFVIVIDREFKVTWANKVTNEFYRCSPVGENFETVFKPYGKDAIQSRIEKCFQDNISVEDEIAIHKENRKIDLRYTASVATLSDDGVPETLILVYRDITEKKLWRAETIRSGQLASIGELAAGVAHEINNPVNGIINCAQLLLDDDADDGEQAAVYERIYRAGGRIAVIVRNLLSFARDTDDAPLRIPVPQLLSDCLDLTETQIKKEGICLDIRIPDHFPKIYVRRHQILQVFLNIISNARYALNNRNPDNPEPKKIEIRAQVLTNGSPSMACLTFYDNGTGIKEEILTRICDPFFSSKPPGEGTGLGLSISHNIIKEHGGELKFESVENLFTRVILVLPIQSEEAVEQQTQNTDH